MNGLDSDPVGFFQGENLLPFQSPPILINRPHLYPIDRSEIGGFSSEDDDLQHSTDVSLASYSSERQRIVNVSDPIDALSRNPDRTCVVAAGSRGVLKIFRLSDDSLDEMCDLRASRRRKQNLLYFACHVDWCPADDVLIATTSSNGAVVLWDVHQCRLKHNYKSHTRSATVVNFHRTNKHLLISGSKDNNVNLYDLRVKEQHASTFNDGAGDSIRDLAFCLHEGQHDYFVSADDSGRVCFWDTRNPDRPLRHIMAHRGYTASISLNPVPESRNLVATGGGRDKFIKIWDFSAGSSPNDRPLYVVETQAPVSKVYWRTGEPWQIASCAVVNDMQVHVWDIRRPFLPMYSFDEHRDSVTDMVWEVGNDQQFISSGKDGLLVLHNIQRHINPSYYATQVSIDLSADGLVGVAVNSMIESKNEADRIDEMFEKIQNAPQGYENVDLIALQKQRRRLKTIYDPWRGPMHSVAMMAQQEDAMKELSNDSFAFFATNFKLTGAHRDQLCDLNSSLADEVGEARIAHSWRMLAFYANQAGLKPDKLATGPEAKLKNVEAYRDQYAKVADDDDVALVLREHEPMPLFPYTQGELIEPISILGLEELEDEGIDPSLKTEGFEIHDIVNDNPITDTEDEEKRARELRAFARKKIVEIFDFFSETLDNQMCASMAIVLGQAGFEVIRWREVEMWTHNYIDQLERLEFFAEAISVIHATPVNTKTDRVMERVLEGIVVKVVCEQCGTVIMVPGPCTKCKASTVNTCAVCERGILTAVVECDECAHVYHMEHAASWFRQSDFCAVVGCTCNCKGEWDTRTRRRRLTGGGKTTNRQRTPSQPLKKPKKPRLTDPIGFFEVKRPNEAELEEELARVRRLGHSFLMRRPDSMSTQWIDGEGKTIELKKTPPPDFSWAKVLVEDKETRPLTLIKSRNWSGSEKKPATVSCDQKDHLRETRDQVVIVRVDEEPHQKNINFRNFSQN